MEVKPGDRIKLVSMPSDPDPVEPGSSGTVESVTSGPLGQVWVRWDNQRSLALIPGIDVAHVTGHSDLVAPALGCPQCGNRATDLLTWDEHYEKVTCDLCGCIYEP